MIIEECRHDKSKVLIKKKELEKLHFKLIYIGEFIYVLQMALDNQDQPNADTTPYASLTSFIRKELITVTNEFN